MSLYGIFKFIVGFLLALLLIAGASVAGALYFAAKLQQPPARPSFPNDQPSAAAKPASTTTQPTPKPKPTPIPESLPSGAYRAVVVQPIGLIVRDSPSRNAERIGGVGYQEQVIILEETTDKEWQKVQGLGEEKLEGWVIGGNTERVPGN